MTNPFLSLAVLDTNLDFSGAKNPNPYCAQIRSQGSRRRICPHRLAVPEKIFALPACSIFSTAAGAPPRFIRHWRRSAPHPLPLPRSGGGAVWANNCLFKFQSRQRDFLRLTPRQIAVLAALRCPKKSSRCSLARFFRPLRMLRLAASATGGARLRIPIHRDPLIPPNLHNKSQLQFPSKIRYLCDLRPISSHNVNFPLKKVKY